VFWIKCNSGEALHSLQQDVDAHFANTPNETKSLDENAFSAQFIQASGDLPGLMRQMAVVVLVIVALVAGNTMMMSFRERTREFAVFKAMGFPHGRVARIVLAESLIMALVGAAAGIIPMALALRWFPLNRFGFLPIANLKISPIAIGVSLGVSILVGLAAGAWPAYQALRLRTVEALRSIA
jgi:putative ABC transport system permease protein